AFGVPLLAFVGGMLKQTLLRVCRRQIARQEVFDALYALCWRYGALGKITDECFQFIPCFSPALANGRNRTVVLPSPKLGQLFQSLQFLCIHSCSPYRGPSPVGQFIRWQQYPMVPRSSNPHSPHM